MPNMPLMPALDDFLPSALPPSVRLRPKPPGDRVVEIQHGGGVRLDAHFFSIEPVETPFRAPILPLPTPGISAP